MPTKKRSRVKEPSTYAGIGGLISALAIAFPQHAPIIAAVSAAASALAVYLPERSGD